jgi:hypothetical protein
MNHNFENPDLAMPESAGAAQAAEQTLRLVAALPPPNGLKDRVHRRLHDAMDELKTGHARRGFWSLWRPMQRLQFAGAAVLCIALAGSAWSVYHNRSAASNAVPVSTKTSAPTAQPAPASTFHSAGAERVPPSLAPIKVPPASRKKPSPSHAARHTAKPAAGEAQATSSVP